MKRKRWTEAETEQLRQLYPTTLCKDLAKVFNCEIAQVYNRANKVGLHKNAEWLLQHYKDTYKGHERTQFQKGMKSWNKGMKGLQIGGKETQFKKGQTPHNTKPIGHRSTRDGYLVEKTENGFEFVHVLLYKQHHGEIPAGKFVRFIDGNRQNICVDNLMLIDRKAHMLQNSIQNLPEPIKQVIHIKKSITRKINQLEKNGTQ
jgi:hypothetical protein